MYIKLILNSAFWHVSIQQDRKQRRLFCRFSYFTVLRRLEKNTVRITLHPERFLYMIKFKGPYIIVWDAVWNTAWQHWELMHLQGLRAGLIDSKFYNQLVLFSNTFSTYIADAELHKCIEWPKYCTIAALLWLKISSTSKRLCSRDLYVSYLCVMLFMFYNATLVNRHQELLYTSLENVSKNNSFRENF